MEKKLIVACGTGIATSTVVVKKLEEALEKHGVKARIVQCKIAEIESHATGANLIVTTTTMGPVKGVPVIQAISFLTGIGIESDIAKIIDILKKD